MTLVLHDELFDAQLVRALAYAPSGGAELGEVLDTGKRIDKTDCDLWYREWTATADRVAVSAAASFAAGHRASARGAYLRASNYYRTAGLFMMGAPLDHRMRHSSRRQTETFRAAAALMELPPDILQIPYENTTLPGYFFRAADDGAARPTVILVDGYDGTVEELYFANVTAALARGYNALAFDGPGQGSVIVEQDIPFRPDWEAVVTPVVDFALTLPEVDPAALVLMGWSLGGYLAPRAATAEHRLAACISDSGPYDLFEVSEKRIPGLLAHQLPDGNPVALRILESALDNTMKKPSAGWALRRGLWVHGVETPLDYLRIAPQYSLKGLEKLIRCPTFVASTEGDDLSALAEHFAEQLSCPHEFALFTADEAVSGHCEMTGRALFHQRAFDWLDGILGRAS